MAGNEAIEAVVREDPELQARIRQVVEDSLEEIEEIIHEGSPPMKMALLRTMTPVLVRQLQGHDENEEIKRLQDEMEALRKEIRGE